MNRIYLDFAASAPLSTLAKRSIESTAKLVFANPSSIHAEGRAGRQLLDNAHTQIATVFGVGPTEIVLTSGASEANALAISGTLRAWRLHHPDEKPHVITTNIEHPSVTQTLAIEDADVTKIPVDKNGIINADEVIRAITPNTALVTIIYVNNEIGTVQPIANIGKQIVELRGKNHWPIFHTDAVQAFPYNNCHVGHTHADLTTFSGHKYGAIGGIGGLVAQKNTPIASIIKGGSQEWGLRAGTENVIGAVCLGNVVTDSSSRSDELTHHVRDVQQAIEDLIAKKLPQITVTGQNALRSPHITHLWIPNVTDSSLVARLDLAGYSVSSGSACSIGSIEPSPVLLALGYSRTESFGGLRISYGPSTSLDDATSIINQLETMLR